MLERAAIQYTEVPPGASAESPLTELAKSIAYSAVGAPVTSVGQMFDINYQFLPQLKPEYAVPGTFDYYVQGVGGAIGLGADMLALRWGLGEVAGAALGKASGPYKFLTSAVGGSLVTGTVYGAAFTPVSAFDRDQVSSRLMNAGLNGATFAALAAAGEVAGTKLALTKTSPLAKSFATVGTNIAIGAPIGALSTQARSLLYQHDFAGWDETKQAALDWAVIGGIMSVPDALGARQSAKPEAMQVKPAQDNPPNVFDWQTLAEAGKPAQQLYLKTLPSMFRIDAESIGKGHTGTAFAISEDRAATAYHVVANVDKLTATAANGSKYQFVVDRVDPASDLAIIRRVETSGTRRLFGLIRRNAFKPLTLAQNGDELLEAWKLDHGPPHPVYGLGYGANARASNPQIAPGIYLTSFEPPEVRNLPANLRPDRKVVWSTSQIVPGFSGGPMLNDAGEVIGVNFAIKEDRSMGYSIPVSTLKNLLTREGKPDYSNFLPLLKTTERSPASPAETKLFEKLYAAAKPSIFKIRGISQKGTPQFGTAFAIDSEGYFIAGKEMASLQSVQLNHNESWSINLKPLAQFQGLSILKADPAEIGQLKLQALPLGTPRQLLEARQVIALGYPTAMADLNVSIGTLQPQGPTKIAASDGFAGAPVINQRGRVVGVIASLADGSARAQRSPLVDTKDVKTLLKFVRPKSSRTNQS